MPEADACGSFSCFEYSLVPMTRGFMDINKATMENAKAGADIYSSNNRAQNKKVDLIPARPL